MLATGVVRWEVRVWDEEAGAEHPCWACFAGFTLVSSRLVVRINHPLGVLQENIFPFSFIRKECDLHGLKSFHSVVRGSVLPVSWKERVEGDWELDLHESQWLRPALGERRQISHYWQWNWKKGVGQRKGLREIKSKICGFEVVACQKIIHPVCWWRGCGCRSVLQY